MPPTHITSTVAFEQLGVHPTLTVAVPTHTDGDLLLLIAWQGVPDETTLDLPGGWTEDDRRTVNSEVSAVFAHRIAASEPSDYTIGYGGVPEAVWIGSWTDQGGINADAFTSGAAPPGSAGPVSTADGGTIAGFFAAVGVGTSSADIPAGFTPLGGISSAGGSWPVCVGHGGELASDGTTMGPYAFSVAGDIDFLGWVAGLWALRPLAFGGWGVGQIRMGVN